jgi:hypothetical protein
VERRLAITTHAQDGSETDHFSFDVLQLFRGLRGVSFEAPRSGELE